MGSSNGVTTEQIQSLHDYENSTHFTEEERLVLRYADAMTRTPVDVPDELFAAMRERFSTAQLVELTSCIAWENYRARFDHAFGVESAGFAEAASCPLPEQAVAAHG